jgi:hypothetical protein
MVTIGFLTCFRLEIVAAEGLLIKLGVVAGDGVGPEVTAEALLALAAVARIEGFDFQTVAFDLGGEHYPIERLSACAVVTPFCSEPSATPALRPECSKRGYCSASGSTSTSTST